MDKFAMHKAAKYGDLETVRQLIDEGVPVDSRDDHGHTPMHVAATWGQYNVVQLLISSKCDINAVDHLGSTPVLTAAFLEEKDVTDLLLRHGAQVSRADQNNRSLLHCASENGWADTVQHILSLEEEVDLNAATSEGHTPLMLAAIAESEDCAEILLGAGADPNRRDGKHEWTALHWAVIYSSTRVIRVMLGVEGMDINVQNVNGWTPLHFASMEENREVLKEMLEAGADYTIRDNSGETALSVGIKRMKLTVEDIRLFVQQGLYFQEKEYMCIFQNSILKESVLKDTSLCTQSVVNKFHRHSLPALKSISSFAEQIPNIDNFKLNDWEVDEVEKFVQCEIGRSNYCNVLKVHPMSLKALCILTLTS